MKLKDIKDKDLIFGQIEKSVCALNEMYENREYDDYAGKHRMMLFIHEISQMGIHICEGTFEDRDLEVLNDCIEE